MEASSQSADDALDAIRVLDLATSRHRAALASGWGITVSDSLVLSNLATAGGQLTPRDLGRRLVISSGTLTTMLDRLAAGGYVVRAAHPHDRRSLLVRLTDRGREILTESSNELNSALDEAVPEPARTQLTTTLHALAAAIDKLTVTLRTRP